MTSWPCHGNEQLPPAGFGISTINNNFQDTHPVVVKLLQRLVCIAELLEHQQQRCSEQLEVLLHHETPSCFGEQPTMVSQAYDEVAENIDQANSPECVVVKKGQSQLPSFYQDDEATAFKHAASGFTESSRERSKETTAAQETKDPNISRNSLTHAVLTAKETFESERSAPSRRVITNWREFISSHIWEYIMVPFMLVDSITIGMELDRRLQTGLMISRISMRRVGDGFLIFWILELLLRIISVGCRTSFKHKYIVCDSTLLCLSVVSEWVLSPLDSTGFVHAVFWRLARLMRVMRALRFIPIFDQTWRMLCGVFFSLSSLLSAGLLLLFVIYVFACLGMELLTYNEDIIANQALMIIVNERFNSVPRAMLTLVSYIGMDSVAGLYEPFIEFQPLLTLYFMPIMVIISIAIMNLVLATVLESAMRSVQLDKEMSERDKKRNMVKLKPIIRKMFDQLDKDGDGTIELEEVMAWGVDVPKQYEDRITLPAVIDLFQSIDSDKSGSIEKSEWEEGLLFLALSESPIESTQILQLMRRQNRKFAEFEKDLQKLIEACVPEVQPIPGNGSRSAWRASVNQFAPQKHRQPGMVPARDVFGHQKQQGHSKTLGAHHPKGSFQDVKDMLAGVDDGFQSKNLEDASQDRAFACPGGDTAPLSVR